MLLLKVGTGGRSLGWDFLPPETKRYTFENRSYAGHGECPDSSTLESTETTKCDLDNAWLSSKKKCLKCFGWYAGKYTVEHVNMYNFLNYTVRIHSQ